MLAQVERIEVLEGPEGLLVPHGCPTQRAEDHDPLWALANEPGGPACAKASRGPQGAESKHNKDAQAEKSENPQQNTNSSAFVDRMGYLAEPGGNHARDQAARADRI